MNEETLTKRKLFVKILDKKKQTWNEVSDI